MNTREALMSKKILTAFNINPLNGGTQRLGRLFCGQREIVWQLRRLDISFKGGNSLSKLSFAILALTDESPEELPPRNRHFGKIAQAIIPASRKASWIAAGNLWRTCSNTLQADWPVWIC
jgi:hypothetical protein